MDTTLDPTAIDVDSDEEDIIGPPSFDPNDEDFVTCSCSCFPCCHCYCPKYQKESLDRTGSYQMIPSDGIEFQDYDKIRKGSEDWRTAKKIFGAVKKGDNATIKEQLPKLKRRTYNSICHVAARHDKVNKHVYWRFSPINF